MAWERRSEGGDLQVQRVCPFEDLSPDLHKLFELKAGLRSKDEAVRVFMIHVSSCVRSEKFLTCPVSRVERHAKNLELTEAPTNKTPDHLTTLACHAV